MAASSSASGSTTAGTDIVDQTWMNRIARQLRNDLLHRCSHLRGVMDLRDPFRIAETLGVQVEYVAMPHACGRLFRHGDRWTILVPKSCPLPRQRFACAHELGHFLLGNYGSDTTKWQGATGTLSDDNTVEIQERICNLFAQELLLPAEELEAFCQHQSLQLAAFWTIIERFDSSLRATAIRIADLYEDYAFVLARVNSTEPRRGFLAVAWTARPRNIFLPNRKVISPSSSMWRAFQDRRMIIEWEENVLGRLRGEYLIEAAPLDRSRGIFALIHLRDRQRPLQLRLPFANAVPVSYRDTHPEERKHATDAGKQTQFM